MPILSTGRLRLMVFASQEKNGPTLRPKPLARNDPTKPPGTERSGYPDKEGVLNRLQLYEYSA
jgi:hypothetical protein